ncbi:MAG: hypothetical protein ABSE73_26735, partial [Planctomycetota bacterium]
MRIEVVDLNVVSHVNLKAGVPGLGLKRRGRTVPKSLDGEAEKHRVVEVAVRISGEGRGRAVA